MDKPELPVVTKEIEKPIVPRIRIAQIHIENYKGIKNLDLKFNDRPIPSDPDICVIGSANGVGKTAGA